MDCMVIIWDRGSQPSRNLGQHSPPAYRLAGRVVMNENNVLKLQTNFFKMLLFITYYYKQVFASKIDH
jgi:hypothetical protein